MFHFHTGSCHSEHISRIVNLEFKKNQTAPCPPGIFTFTVYISRYVICLLKLGHGSVLFPALSYLYWVRTRGGDTSIGRCVVVSGGGCKQPPLTDKGDLASFEVFII
jgi:hypothetical protein